MIQPLVYIVGLKSKKPADSFLIPIAHKANISQGIQMAKPNVPEDHMNAN